MDTKQKFKAINALAPAEIKLDYHDNFFVSHRVHIRSAPKAPTQISVVGRGPMPNDAIEAHWDLLIAAQSDNPLCVDYGGQDRGYIWNGFMWLEVYCR